jgi:hypothetical protein
MMGGLYDMKGKGKLIQIATAADRAQAIHAYADGIVDIIMDNQVRLFVWRIVDPPTDAKGTSDVSSI